MVFNTLECKSDFLVPAGKSDLGALESVLLNIWSDLLIVLRLSLLVDPISFKERSPLFLRAFTCQLRHGTHTRWSIIFRLLVSFNAVLLFLGLYRGRIHGTPSLSA